jgi:hypothetical protein
MMEFEISAKEYGKILKEAEDNIRASITLDVVKKYLKDNKNNISISERIIELGISSRLKKIQEKKVGDLDTEDKLCIILEALDTGLDF